MSGKKGRNKAKNEKKRSNSYLMTVLIGIVALVLLANCLSVFATVNEKKEKNNALQELYNEELVIKAEYEYLLAEENQLEYIERIARERYGYVAPGERAFYDSSYGK